VTSVIHPSGSAVALVIGYVKINSEVRVNIWFCENSFEVGNGKLHYQYKMLKLAQLELENRHAWLLN
jgi:hypothetical protein